MRLFNSLILGLITFWLTLEGIAGDCLLGRRPPYPLVVTRFGSNHLAAESLESSLTIDDGQRIELYCAKGFNGYRNTYPGKITSESNLKLNCMDGQLYSDTGELYNYNLACVGEQSAGMYESRSSLPDCHDYISLVVGHKLKSYGSMKSVAICYDVIKQEVKYVSYTAYPTKIRIIEQAGQLNRLGLDIDVSVTKSLLKPISALQVQTALNQDKEFKDLFGEQTFEYANLVQDQIFSTDLTEFSEMLSIIWLRALRVGNWRHLLKALQSASLNAKYDVRVGFSGVVALPMLQRCNDTRSLTIDLDTGDTLSVPAHIWAHVRAVEPTVNSTEEFVVVAQNSPFFTNNEREGFCTSICNEVSWLRDSLFGKLQNYPVYGLVQCCRLSEVAHKLDHFPQGPFEVPTETTE